MLLSKVSSLHSVKVLKPDKLWSRAGSGAGAGAGKGGGAGGSVREAGGGLGQYGAAQEESYFYNKQREQLEKLKKTQQGEAQEKANELKKKD